MAIKLTDPAVKEIKRVMEQQKLELSDYVIEVSVGGSCSGPQYRIGFRKKESIDSLNETSYFFDNLEVIIDNTMAPYLDFTTVDYFVSDDKKGFVFIKPESGCGNGSCGSCGC